MLFQMLRVHALAIGIAALLASVYLIILARPHCEDGMLKTCLLGMAIFGLWPLAGMLTGYVARAYGGRHGLLVAVVGCPLAAALWLGLLWGWDRFSAPFYWSILRGFLIVGLPLTTLGGLLGSFFHSRQRAFLGPAT